MLAYSDETGNSGNNLFDAGQPEFWTGTLICGTDLDRAGAAIHAECLKLTGRPELHGNALGLSGIEKIASPLQEFFAKHECHFLFTRLEKNHLASTKFFDGRPGCTEPAQTIQIAFTETLNLAARMARRVEHRQKIAEWFPIDFFDWVRTELAVPYGQRKRKA